MDGIHRCMFHALAIGINISLLKEATQHDWESLAVIGLLMCTANALAIEVFFRSNRQNYLNFIENPNFKNAKKILF